MAELLEDVVKHDFAELVIGRDVQFSDEAFAVILVLDQELMKDDDPLAVS